MSRSTEVALVPLVVLAAPFLVLPSLGCSEVSSQSSNRGRTRVEEEHEWTIRRECGRRLNSNRDCGSPFLRRHRLSVPLLEGETPVVREQVPLSALGEDFGCEYVLFPGRTAQSRVELACNEGPLNDGFPRRRSEARGSCSGLGGEGAFLRVNTGSSLHDDSFISYTLIADCRVLHR